jgi:hypothetical protein
MPLLKDANKIDEAVTDNYGDFKFDGLEEDSGRYMLEIECEGYEKKALEINVKTSLNVGTIWL